MSRPYVEVDSAVAKQRRQVCLAHPPSRDTLPQSSLCKLSRFPGSSRRRAACHRHGSHMMLSQSPGP